jgi:16S rRNA U1498 N3-methylase RsmE
MNASAVAATRSDTYEESLSALLRDQYGIETDADLDRLRRVRNYLLAACVQSERLNMRLSTYEEFFAPVHELIGELDEVLDALLMEEMHAADRKETEGLPSGV